MNPKRALTPLVAAFLLSGLAAADELPLGESFKLRSDILGEERTVLVHTPLGYEGGSARYSVLYLTDGESQFFHTVGTVEFLTRTGRMAPVIVVGVTNLGGDRTRDLTQTHSSITLRGNDTPLPTSGGGEKFLDFFEKELIPHVEKTYRTLPYRIFAGHSFGGLFALHALATRPGLFSGVVAASPTLSWDRDLPLKEMKALFEKHPDLRATLFVTTGNEGPELEKRLVQLEKILGRVKSRGFHWGVMRLPDENHGSVVLLSHYHGLRKIYEGWLPEIDPRTGTVKGDLAGLKAHYQGLSQRFGFTIVPAEAAVNQLGYAALFARRFDAALQAFRYNVEVYPESANVHDSLGEALEAQGMLEEARQAYRKAVEMGRQAGDANLTAFEQHLTALEQKLGGS